MGSRRDRAETKLVDIYTVVVYLAVEASMRDNLDDWNARTIAEFHSNHGKVGGQFEGAPLLLLHHIGARSGKSRINPMMYLKDGDRYLVFASKAGADTNPDWYHNLKAHPEVQIEVGDETIDVRAEEITGHERDRLYAHQASLYPAFAKYQRQTKRIIPVMALTPKT
jgi:deazaflavin-dependent oxidoreductase (nitroreductase family)